MWSRPFELEEMDDLYRNRDGVPDMKDPELRGHWDFDEIPRRPHAFYHP